MDVTPSIEFSVVVATSDAALSIDGCLQHLDAAMAGMRSEVIVCDGSDDGTAERLEQLGHSTRLHRYPAGTLTPVLWAEGLRRSAGRVVALTTGHCLVSPSWAKVLLRALDGGASAAGGPLVLARDTRPLDWAVFYLRYSAFLPETIGSGHITGEIAGDNAAYVRQALARHEAAFTRGFWEIDVHRLLRADGGWIAVAPDALVEFGRSFRAVTIVAQRFAHGREFGAGRAQRGTRPAWLLVLSAPIVPFVLAGRAGRRVFGAKRGRARFLGSLPWFFVIATAWAAGEAWGALVGPKA
jgi:glycosyltransferase involved in cell wall biosynthesis